MVKLKQYPASYISRIPKFNRRGVLVLQRVKRVSVSEPERKIK